MDCENRLTPKHGVRVIRDPGEFRVVGMYTCLIMWAQAYCRAGLMITR